MTESRKLRLFLCHSSQDKPIVRELYQRLNTEGWIDPWLDEEKLLPGMDWDLEIEKAVEGADAVIVCLSNNSVTKEGYVQRELKFVLDIALEKPEGTIFVVPLRLDDCTLPRRLRAWHYVDYFPIDQRKRAYQRLLQSLNVRHSQLTPKEDAIEKAVPAETGKVEKVHTEIKIPIGSTVPSTAMPSGLLDLGSAILPMAYFLLAGFYAFGDSGDVLLQSLLAATAILTGLFFLLKRQIVATIPLKIAVTLFLITHCVVTYSDYRGLGFSDAFSIFEGIVAWIVVGLLVAAFRAVRKPATYSAILLAVFLFLVGLKLIFGVLQYYPPGIYNPILISGILASILVWLEL